jgi:chromosome partitioning protein
MTEVIAFSNQKGGVAKTTSCLSLGASLTELGQSVLLIDLDPQANLTLSVGLKPKELHRTIEDALLGNQSLVSVSRESQVSGLDIVPANQGLIVLEKVLYGRQGFQYRLRHSVEAMDEGLYDYVLIDCPPSFGTLTINALTAAHLLVIPIQCEYFAAYTLRQYIGIIQRMRAKTNSQLRYKVLITMYDRRNKIMRVIHEQMQQGLNNTLFDTVIEVDTKLRESPVYGQPITLYAPGTRGAQQYRALAKELLNHGQ